MHISSFQSTCYTIFTNSLFCNKNSLLITKYYSRETKLHVVIYKAVINEDSTGSVTALQAEIRKLREELTQARGRTMTMIYLVIIMYKVININ